MSALGERAETAVIDLGPLWDVVVRRNLIGNKPTLKDSIGGKLAAATEKGEF